MAAKIGIVLCEGAHDVAFLSTILKSVRFSGKSDTTILSKFPKPMNDYIINEIKKSNIEDIKFDQIRNSLIPTATLLREQCHIFLYSLGGDSKKELRQKILKEIIGLIPESIEEGNGMEEIIKSSDAIKISFIYFFDADNLGVKERINQINQEIEEISGIKPISEHSTFGEVNGLNVGAFIFTGDDDNTGKLEDILLPMMESGNEGIFNDASTYIDTHYDDSRSKKNNYNRDKAKIGIAGQLQKSGMTNAVIISQTDYITPAKIIANNKCQEIIAFFEDHFEN
jgi:hypothetical protein